MTVRGDEKQALEHFAVWFSAENPVVVLDVPEKVNDWSGTHPSCAVWTAGWKAGTVVGLGAVHPTPNKRKTCFSSPQTVTNVSAVFGLLVVVVRLVQKR